MCGTAILVHNARTRARAHGGAQVGEFWYPHLEIYTIVHLVPASDNIADALNPLHVSKMTIVGDAARREMRDTSTPPRLVALATIPRSSLLVSKPTARPHQVSCAHHCQTKNKASIAAEIVQHSLPKRRCA